MALPFRHGRETEKPDMQQLQHQILFFDGFTLDLTRGCLLRGTGEVKLRPKSFEVLRHLAENSGRLVSKEEMIEAVWAGERERVCGIYGLSWIPCVTSALSLF